MTRYTDVDGNTHDAGSEVQRTQVERFGGTLGAWTDAAPADEVDTGAAVVGEPGQYEPAQEPAYAEEDYGPEYEDEPQPQVPDPFDDDFGPQLDNYLDQRVAERLGQGEHGREWEAEQRVRDVAAEQQNLEASYEQLAAMTDEATHGRLQGDETIRQDFIAQTAGSMLDTAEQVAAELVNQGHDPNEVWAGLERALPQLHADAVASVQDQRSIDDMKAQFRAHFGRGR